MAHFDIAVPFEKFPVFAPGSDVRTLTLRNINGDRLVGLYVLYDLDRGCACTGFEMTIAGFWPCLV